MATYYIIKKSSKTWVIGTKQTSQGYFRIYTKNSIDYFEFTEPAGSDLAQDILVTDIIVQDDTNGGAQTTYISGVLLSIGLEALDFPYFKTASGGSGAGTLQEVTDLGNTTTNNIISQGFTSSGTREGGDLIHTTGDYNGNDTGLVAKLDMTTGDYYIGDVDGADTGGYYRFRSDLNGIELMRGSTVLSRWTGENLFNFNSDGSGKSIQISFPTPSGNNTATVQDATGILAFLSDISGSAILDIDSMRLFTEAPNNNSLYYLQGYSNINDGGQGYFYWDNTSTDTDDGGLIIKATSITTGRFKRVYEGSPKVEHYGVSETNTGAGNLESLRSACAVNEKLTITGFYDIDISGSEIQLESIFELIGLEKWSGFNFTDSGTLFKGKTIGNIFKLSGLNITYNTDPTSTVSNIFRLQSGDYYQSVEVNNCYISGHLRAVLCISGDFDPSIVNFGIDKIKVTNNNCLAISGTTFFIVDSPSIEEIVENNTIRNLQGTFYYSALDNGSTNRAVINDARVKVNIKNNTVTNDISVFPNDVPATYFALAVIESYNVLYNNNEVRGLKTQQTQAIYDAYLSSTNVTYTNNRWYNNVCFDATDVVNNQLIKSKANESLVYLNSKRVYKNNIWVIESDFLTEIGKTSADCWNNFYQVPSGCDFILENNLIDIYGIILPTSSDAINSFNINSNTIILDYIKQDSDAIFFFEYDNIYDSESFLNRNKINIKSNPLSTTTSFFKTNSAIDFEGKLEISYNSILCDNTSLEYFIDTFVGDELEIIGNTIIGQFESPLYNLSVGKINGYGNNFKTTLSTNYFPSNRGDFIQNNGKFELSSFNSGDMRFGVFNTPTTETWYKYIITYQDGNGEDSFSFKYRVYDDAGTKKINFINESGTEIDMELSTGSGNDFISQERLTGYSNGLQVFYVNHSSVPYIVMLGESTDEFLKTIKLNVYQGTGDLQEKRLSILPQYTVATLPTGLIGQKACVTDANAPLYRATATGGGSDFAEVIFDNTNWIYN